jgi:hypothetical protein
MAAPFRHIDGKMPRVIVLAWGEGVKYLGAMQGPPGGFFRRLFASAWWVSGEGVWGVGYGPLGGVFRVPRGAS